MNYTPEEREEMKKKSANIKVETLLNFLAIIDVAFKGGVFRGSDASFVGRVYDTIQNAIDNSLNSTRTREPMREPMREPIREPIREPRQAIVHQQYQNQYQPVQPQQYQPIQQPIQQQAQQQVPQYVPMNNNSGMPMPEALKPMQYEDRHKPTPEMPDALKPQETRTKVETAAQQLSYNPIV